MEMMLIETCCANGDFTDFSGSRQALAISRRAALMMGRVGAGLVMFSTMPCVSSWLCPSWLQKAQCQGGEES